MTIFGEFLAKLFIKFYRLLLVPVVLMINFLYPVSVSVSDTGNFWAFSCGDNSSIKLSASF